MGERTQGVHLAGRALGRHRHVCAFFNGQDEEYKVLIPFVKEGIEQGDRVFYIVDADRQTDHLRQLGQAGIDTDPLHQSGQLDVHPWKDVHLRSGHFDQDAVLSLLDEVLAGSKEQGFPVTRIWSNQEWALGDHPGVADIVEYEARFNYVSAKYADPVVCVFDLAKFGAGVVMDILRTHPVALIGGILQENPYFVPPDEFLRELRLRSGPAAGP